YHDGYSAAAVTEEKRLGVRVIRTYVWPYRGNVTWKRIVNYGSFAISAWLFGAARLEPFDVLYVFHPPLTISLPAWFIAATQDVPFIYDVQDLWPEAGLAAGVLGGGWFYDFLSAWERWVYRRATHLTVLAYSFRDRLAA